MTKHPKTKNLTTSIHSDTVIDLHGQPPLITLRDYETQTGERPVRRWFDKLDPAIAARLWIRIDRFAHGNMGDIKSVGDGVQEMRFHFGTGYRVYFAHHGHQIIILLCGGDKSTQEKDIKNAKTYWQDYKKRNKKA